MKADYLKFVQWSEENSFYVGYCPDLFIGGACHGKDESKVYTQLCQLVAEDLQQRRREKKPLPNRKALVALAVAI